MSRREQALALLAEVSLALDDDDIDGRLNIDRHYVNTIYRTLAGEGVVAREPGPDGKLQTLILQRATRSAVPQRELLAKGAS